MQFLTDYESVYEKIYLNTKELFSYYIDRLKLKGQGENIPDIIQKIKIHMKNLIASVAYVEDLLEMISEIKEINRLKNEFYEIFVGCMELMNEEGNPKRKMINLVDIILNYILKKNFILVKNILKKMTH